MKISLVLFRDRGDFHFADSFANGTVFCSFCTASCKWERHLFGLDTPHCLSYRPGRSIKSLFFVDLSSFHSNLRRLIIDDSSQLAFGGFPLHSNKLRGIFDRNGFLSYFLIRLLTPQPAFGEFPLHSNELRGMRSLLRFKTRLFVSTE
jgi:hypothetical protein